jgi:hypothetical protein
MLKAGSGRRHQPGQGAARHRLGDRAFEVTDPSGFLLTIGSPSTK